MPPVTAPLLPAIDDARRSRARRLTLLLALIAAGAYIGFIALQILRARGA